MSVPWSHQPRPPPANRVNAVRAWDLDLFSSAHEALVDQHQIKKEGDQKPNHAFQQGRVKLPKEREMKLKEDERNIKEEECDSLYSSASSTDGSTTVKLSQIPVARTEISNDKKRVALKRNVPCDVCGNDVQQPHGLPGSFCVACTPRYDKKKKRDLEQLTSQTSYDLATNMSLAYRNHLNSMLGYSGLTYQAKERVLHDFDLTNNGVPNSSIDIGTLKENIHKSAIFPLNSENISDIQKVKVFLEKSIHEAKKQQTQIEENNGLCVSKKYKQCDLEKSVDDFRRIHESMLQVDEMKKPDDSSTNVNRINEHCDSRIDLGKTRLHHENLVYSNKSSKNSDIHAQFRNSKHFQISRYSTGITKQSCDSKENIIKSKYPNNPQTQTNHLLGSDRSLVITDYLDFMSKYKNQASSSSVKPVVPQPKKSMEELQLLLEPSDIQEIVLLEKHLMASYGELPESARVHYPCCNKMTTAFKDFIQRRTYFYKTLPCCARIDPEQRAAQLRQAVSMSCHVTGAQWIDPVTFQWPDFRACCAGIPHLEASQLRKVLPTDDFLKLMTFYKKYYQYFSDERATLLVMNLLPFLPEKGATSVSKTVEEGRNHYTGILSRYLKIIHGPEDGEIHLSKIHEGFIIIQQLVSNQKNVDLLPSMANDGENEDRKKNLNESVNFLCDSLSSAIIQRKETKYKPNGSLDTDLHLQSDVHMKYENNSEEFPNVNNMDKGIMKHKNFELDNFSKKDQQNIKDFNKCTNISQNKSLNACIDRLYNKKIGEKITENLHNGCDLKVSNFKQIGKEIKNLNTVELEKMCIIENNSHSSEIAYIVNMLKLLSESKDPDVLSQAKQSLSSEFLQTFLNMVQRKTT